MMASAPATTKTNGTMEAAAPSALDRAIEETDRKWLEIEAAIADVSFDELQLSSLMSGLKVARTMRQLRALLDEKTMQPVLALMNTSLGFLTDKDPSKSKNGNATLYHWEVVRDCFIEAMIRGAHMLGNEWNIISGRPYFTQAYYVRKVGELPGVTNVVASPGLARKDGEKTVVRYGLAWVKNGKPDMLKDAEGKPGRSFEIKVNDFMGADAIVGKATRKAYKAAYEQMTGCLSAPDGEIDEVAEKAVATAARPNLETLTDNLEAKEAKALAESKGELASEEQLDLLNKFRSDKGLSPDQYGALLQPFGVQSSSQLTVDQAEQILKSVGA